VLRLCPVWELHLWGPTLTHIPYPPPQTCGCVFLSVSIATLRVKQTTCSVHGVCVCVCQFSESNALLLPFGCVFEGELQRWRSLSIIHNPVNSVSV